MNRVTKIQTTPSMSEIDMAPCFKVFVFEQEHFQSKCQELTTECCNIQERGFDNIRSSGDWVWYDHHDFQGQQFVLETGEYPHWDAYRDSLGYHVEMMMSLHPIFCAVSPCTNTLKVFFVCYEYTGYRGQQYVMECNKHSGDYQHWKDWGSHCQTPKIQSICRIQH
ncbi:beta-crystallin A3-like [Xyrauchen texanus]|uniref:beta-crystallin A3-like n=1 Tax=Xyrauchen texanus TaxID=154827 RepID=UPI002241A205|nr:beta-crystallin A3-like [Xyrauchen texanus]